MSIMIDFCNDLDLIFQPEPDFDVLLFRLSLYAFTRLSLRDQQVQVEEIRRNVKVEDVVEKEQDPVESDEPFRLRSTFSELFKKLTYSDQLELFLSKVIHQFVNERQLGEFKRLDAEHQKQLIQESTVHLARMNLLLHQGETEEDFRLRQLTQLCRYHADYVYTLLINMNNSEDDEEEEETSEDDRSGSDWRSCFTDFFLGFSKIWFEGQSKRSQDLLIEKLSNGVTITDRVPYESEEDFKLRKFTGLCKKVASRKIVDVKVQIRFLFFAEKKLKGWSGDYSKRLIGEPQDFDSAAELLSRLSTFGFSLLSAKYQQQNIDEMSNQVESHLIVVEESMDDEEDMRVKTFTKLFDQVPLGTRVGFYEKLKKHLSTFGDGRWPEADRKRKEVREGISDYKEEWSPYAEFLFHVAMTWFKARGANYWRNPIYVILFGKVEISDVIEKLPEENEDNFRLRRFTETFKRLQISFREEIVRYIVDALLLSDLGLHTPRKLLSHGHGGWHGHGGVHGGGHGGVHGGGHGGWHGHGGGHGGWHAHGGVHGGGHVLPKGRSQWIGMEEIPIPKTRS